MLKILIVAMNRLSAAGALSAFIANPIKIYRDFHPFLTTFPNGLLNYPVATLTLVTITSPSSTAFPLKHFSATCMHEHRTQGLCYYCNEKFIIGQKCTSGCFLLLVDDDDDDTTTTL